MQIVLQKNCIAIYRLYIYFFNIYGSLHELLTNYWWRRWLPLALYFSHSFLHLHIPLTAFNILAFIIKKIERLDNLMVTAQYDPLKLHLFTSNIRVMWTKTVILVWTLPRLTGSRPNAGEPGQTDNKWAIGTNYTWTRQENPELMEC